MVKIFANITAPKGYKANTSVNGLIDNTQFSMELKLKRNARVMVIVNIDLKDSLVNGSLGTIIDFVKTEKGKIFSDSGLTYNIYY